MISVAGNSTSMWKNGFSIIAIRRLTLGEPKGGPIAVVAPRSGIMFLFVLTLFSNEASRRLTTQMPIGNFDVAHYELTMPETLPGNELP